jgi:hypothetical protein
MKAISEIKSPSQKKRLEILATVFEKNSDIKKSFSNFTDSGKSIDLARKKYNQVALYLCDKENRVTKAYFEEVKRLGYNAIIDDNDAGRLTRSPLILLNSKSVIHETTELLTKSKMRSAAFSIKPMPGENFVNSAEYLYQSPFEQTIFSRYFQALINP